MRFGRRDPFEFDITCPLIDGSLIEIETIVDNALPLPYDLVGYDDKAICAKIMAGITPHLEEVRKTNIKMRDAANEQISELQNDVDSLKDEIDALKREIDRLERKISDYEED